MQRLDEGRIAIEVERISETLWRVLVTGPSRLALGSEELDELDALVGREAGSERVKVVVFEFVGDGERRGGGGVSGSAGWVDSGGETGAGGFH